MGSSRGRTAFAVVLAAHVALFVLLAIGLRPPPAPEAPEVTMAPVYLADLRRPKRTERRTETLPPTAARPLPVLSRRANPSDVAPVPASPPAQPAFAGTEGDAGHLALSKALRGSRVGCANPSLLSDEERARCQDRLEQGSKLAKYIPVPIPPERRAYYDAIAKEKAPVPTLAALGRGPNAARSAELGYPPVVFNSGHGPGVGCKLAFGGGKKASWKRPAHGLKLGPLPCYVMPPSGPLTVEADIQNPDKVIKDPEKAAGEF